MGWRSWTHICCETPPLLRDAKYIPKELSLLSRLENSQDLELSGTDNILTMAVTEPAQTERTVPVVITPKNDRALRFCIGYQKLNTMTALRSYLSAQKDKYIK